MTEKERIYFKKYREEHEEELRLKAREYYLKNKTKCIEKVKKWAEENPEKHKELSNKKSKKYQSTPIGRARHILTAYNTSDRNANRGEGDLTAEWIVTNIFSQPCVHCGETDWRKLGCNRLDNSKPHTMDNVEPCCRKCNRQEQAKEQEANSKPLYQYTDDWELVKKWKNTKEACEALGVNMQNISACCLGKRKSHKGYRWSYELL